MRPGIAGWLQVAAVIATMVAPANAIAAQPSTPSGAAAPATIATVDQPRPFGYVVGDLVTQRVLLQTANPDFEPAALPEAQRLNVWLERRAPRIESTPDGGRWLIVDYQVINAPQTLTTVSLPAWELEPKAGGAKLTIPAWPISVAALTPRAPFATDGLGELRPDRAAPVIPTAPLRRLLVIWSIAFIITLAAWFAWLQQRDWRETLNQPFARALREIRAFGETAPEAWQALHRAFDRTAGRVMQAETLPALFERAPQLESMRPGIERFFAQSNERFFREGLQDELVSVRELCRELRRIEKRYAQ